jgi:serine protease AprX
VVVAAAGNYGVNGQPSDMPFAPGNDPFVITVGANDIDGSIGVADDEAAPWSAYGYTLDGFSKPEIGAPGRYMIGPVPATSTLPRERPGQVRGAGYIELSGTSFAAPLVSGIAAYILSLHPEWTPDQVKGALMFTAKHLPSARPGSLGVGEVNGPRAADVVNPPNPNAALNQFLTRDPNGGVHPVFDAASWARVATENASWARVSYENASWASASWASASWASASWASASWASASWASSAEAAASWATASWASVSYEDGADGDPGVGGEIASPEEQAAAELELGIADPPPLTAP